LECKIRGVFDILIELYIIAGERQALGFARFSLTSATDDWKTWNVFANVEFFI